MCWSRESCLCPLHDIPVWLHCKNAIMVTSATSGVRRDMTSEVETDIKQKISGMTLPHSLVFVNTGTMVPCLNGLKSQVRRVTSKLVA